MSEVSVNRRPIDVSELERVGGMPLVLHVESNGLNAMNWVEEYRDDVSRLLDVNGAVLIRGLKVPGSTQFGKMLSGLFGGELIEYTYRSTPRTALRGNIYTATEYPATEVIPQHNENAYARHWPMRIGFLCVLPAETGGETPIGDSREVYKRLPAEIREKFEAKNVMYVRNYSSLDLPWTEVFQTEDKAQVEAFCQANDMTYEWLEGDTLRTSQVNPASITHPRTGEKVWFNQAHLFHVSSLSPEMAQALIDSMGEARLPRNTYYGDGSPIEPEALAVIRAAYEETKVTFPWQRNDLLLLDNVLFTHGRTAYTGPRKVLVGMACPNA